MRSSDISQQDHIPQERNGLKGLAQTLVSGVCLCERVSIVVLSTCPIYHLICQDAIDAILIERDHPVEASYLVVSHLSILDVPWVV